MLKHSIDTTPRAQRAERERLRAENRRRRDADPVPTAADPADRLGALSTR